MNKNGKGLILWIFSFGLLAFLFLQTRDLNQGITKEVTPTEFKEYLMNDNLSELTFVQSAVKGKVKNPRESVTNIYTLPVTSQEFEEIRKLAVEKKVKYRTIPDRSFLWNIFFILLQMLVFAGLFLWIMGAQMRGAAKFNESKGKRFQPNKDQKTFADVAGCEEAKEEVREIVEFLKNPREFSRLGAKIPKGILLYGAPGTGKTLLAKAVAGEAGVPFISANGSKFIEMFVGVGASRVRDLFENARRSAPCVIFIDEIDAVGGKRGNGATYGGHDEAGQTLNALLEELDGFETNTGIIVVGATNRLDVLDDALIRPGRFDRQIQVPKPDVTGRELILKVHTKNKKIDPSVDFHHIAKDTAGMVGADLENVVNEALLIATKNKKAAVDQLDFSEAVDKVSMGPERKSVKLSEKEKKTTAYHEAGHTLVAMLTPGADPVHKVTINPRGPALGFTKQLPEDRHSITKGELEAMIAVCVGGRAAEELVMGEITTGHHNDFEKATGILRNMINRFGMSDDAGMAVYKDKTDFFGNSAGLDASQKTKELLEKVLNDKLQKTYNQVKELLTKNRSKLDAIADALLEKKTLESKDLDLIMQSFK